MATVTLASPSISSKYVSPDSFSSYLNLIRENLSQELGDAVPKPPTMRITIGKKKAGDHEIDIFGAEKYFNGEMDDDAELGSDTSGRSSCKREGRIIGLKSRSVTVSSCSEMSTNSQHTLLRDHQKKTPTTRQKQANGRRFLGVFRCTCSGKEATKVENQEGSDCTTSRDRRKEWKFEETNGHNIEIILKNLKQTEGRTTVGRGAQQRFSMEAFGSPFIDKGAINSTLRGSFTLLSPASVTGARDDEEEDDLRSEVSSDLFEIDTLSINGHPLFRPEPAYEPSEASIEWSVATASAANFSVASDFSEPRSDETKMTMKNHKPGILLGCASHKAVSVMTDVYKKPERASPVRHEQLRLKGLPPVTRYRSSRAICTR